MSKFAFKKWYFKYPVLSHLMLFQICAILLASVMVILTFSSFNQSQIDSALSQIKEHMVPELDARQEQWRAWHYMSLDEALKGSLETFSKNHPVQEVKILNRSELPEKLSEFEFVVPEKSDFMNTVVYTKVSSQRIEELSKANRFIFIVIAVLAAIFALVIWASARYIRRKIYAPLISLNQAFANMKSNDQDMSIDHLNATGEVYYFLENIRQMHEKTRQMERMAVVGHVASQVAHDIKSPLAALKMAVSNLKEIPENYRLMIRSAVSRIDDIANDLGDKNKRIKNMQNPDSQQFEPALSSVQLSVQLLSSLIDSIISEKRIEYRARPGLTIMSDLGPDSYGLFARIQASEFKRVMSNLINNSSDAVNKDGKITVGMTGACENVRIWVRDNGCGIPNQVVDRVTERGYSFGKNIGSGLGLYHAKGIVESWGGKLEIDSMIGEGTEITITIPRSEAPTWFLPELLVGQNQKVVVLDDDQSIHQIWQNRFMEWPELAKHLIHFTTSDQFENWYDQYGAADNYFFLFDYELLGSKENGLQLIKNYNLVERSVLVTSRFEEGDIPTICEEIDLKLLPKSLAEFVPIKIKDVVNPVKKTKQVAVADAFDGVLIDDDDLVHTVWKLEARTHGKTFKGFKSSTAFFAHHATIHPDTPIYIDVNLADGERGEEVSQKVSAHGFKRVYLTTGLSPDDIDDLPWIKGIRDKRPPWDHSS